MSRILGDKLGRRWTGRWAMMGGLGLMLAVLSLGLGPRPAAVGQAAPLGADIEIYMENNLYLPDVVYASVGDTVWWGNLDRQYHTATSATWDTGVIAPGEWAGITFWEPGEYYYVCLVHPRQTGWLVVEDYSDSGDE